MFRLICIDGVAVGEEVSLNYGETTLGRNDDNDICVLDPEVSRNHCKIYINKGIITVNDVNSCNGFFVNEVRHRDSYNIKAGDLLRLGNTTYMLYDDDNPPANYDEIKKILSKVPRVPQEVMMNILELQMSKTLAMSKDYVPNKETE